MRTVREAVKEWRKKLAEAAWGNLQSLNDIRDVARKALLEEVPAANRTPEGEIPWEKRPYVVDVYPGFIIYEEGDGPPYWRREYSYLDGKLSLGTDKTQVEKSWRDVTNEAFLIAVDELSKETADPAASSEPIRETSDGWSVFDGARCVAMGFQTREAAETRQAEMALLASGGGNVAEAAGDIPLSDVTVYNFLGEGSLMETQPDGGLVVRNSTIICPGRSHNDNDYSEIVLQRDGPPVFEGAPVYATQHVAQEKNINNLIGVHRNVRWDAPTKRLRGDLHVFASAAPVVHKAVEAEAAGLPVGQSINTPAVWTVQQAATGGRRVRKIEALHRGKGTSVEIVMNPSAGGRLAECDEEQQGDTVDISTLTAVLLAGMSQESVAWLVGSLTEAQIREKNPTLAEAIIAKAKPVTAAPPAAGAATEALGQPQAVLTQADLDRAVQTALEAANTRNDAIRNSSLLLETAITRRGRDIGETGVELLRARFGGTTFEAATLDAEVTRLADRQGRGRAVYPNIPGGASLSVNEVNDFNAARLRASMLGVAETIGGHTVTPFNNITQMICAFHPELERAFINSPQYAAQESMRYFQWGGGPIERIVSEASLGTDDLTTAWADSLNRSLVATVADPELNTWRDIVSEFVNFRDLSTSHKLIKVGEIGSFPVVNERAAYQPMAKPDDSQETLSIVKRGGLYSLTWESLLKDDLNVLVRIPQDLGRAWAWTVYDVVFGLLQANSGVGPTMSDALALYHATHGNIASSAFSASTLETVRRKMPLQTDPGSGRRKNGYRGKYLLYASPELDQSIWESLASDFKITASAAEINLPNFIKNVMGLTPVPVVYPETTTERWELVADPRNAPTIAVGFLGGRQVPDILIQNQETVGSMFTSDELTYKARGTCGAAVIDYRSFSRGND